MKDLAGFGLGVIACAVGAIALWAGVGAVNWGWLSWAAPIALIILGVTMLALSRTSTARKEQP